jgi:hypothetical protein
MDLCRGLVRNELSDRPLGHSRTPDRSRNLLLAFGTVMLQVPVAAVAVLAIFGQWNGRGLGPDFISRACQCDCSDPS